MDRLGLHPLSCLKGPHLIRRHNKVRDRVCYWFRKAGFNAKIENKFKDPEEEKKQQQQQQINMQQPQQISMIPKGRPGDVCVENYFNDGRSDQTAYFDVTCVNIYCDSYISHTKSIRLWAASMKEAEKRNKYNNHPNVIPLAWRSQEQWGTHLGMY